MKASNFGSCEIVFKDKIRWYLEGDFPIGKIPLICVQSERPVLTVEEPINFSSKQYWNDIKMTFWLNETSEDIANFLRLISNLDGLFKVNPQNESTFPENQKGTLNLKVCDGRGDLFQEWILEKAFPVKANIDLFHEDLPIEITWRFQSGQVKMYP